MQGSVRLRRVLMLAAGTAFFIFAACASNEGTSAQTGDELTIQTVQAGEVEVKIEPVRIDDTGAVFVLTFDTHTVELDTDLPNAARLVVAGVEWTERRWDGDAPGGHHREGRLTFEAAGPARGPAVLTIDGLPKTVRLSWEVEQS